MTHGPRKKRYARPVVKTEGTEKPAVLLVCTGYPYNCIGEVGYDCCVSIPDECYTNC